jgi:hypothetical protein
MKYCFLPKAVFVVTVIIMWKLVHEAIEEFVPTFARRKVQDITTSISVTESSTMVEHMTIAL